MNRVYTDAQVRDWVLNKGQNVLDDGYTSRARFLLSLRKGTAAAYPQLGSEFHLVTKQTANLPEVLSKKAREALAPMVNDKTLTAVTTKVISNNGDEWVLQITLHLAGKTYAFDHRTFVR